LATIALNAIDRSSGWDYPTTLVHAKTIYPLFGMHTKTACAKCHLKTMPENARYRKLEFTKCNNCHADDHKGEFAKRNNGECAQCHRVEGFVPTTFGPTQHATTAFVLEGKHVVTPCSGCHGNSRPRASYKLPEKICADCHDNPHGTQFAKEMAAGSCGQCHNAADWHQPKIDHSTWPLTGAHGRTACARCHGDAKTVGDKAAFRGVPRDCEGCHEDKHAGQFAQNGLAKACTACHTTEQFRLPVFDHVAASKFALTGKHAAATCLACHPNQTLRNGEIVQRFRLGFRLCKDCHANPHTPGGDK
jgi:hypothetical protein